MVVEAATKSRVATAAVVPAARIGMVVSLVVVVVVVVVCIDRHRFRVQATRGKQHPRLQTTNAITAPATCRRHRLRAHPVR